MSRTYKRPSYRYYRRMSGYRQAVSRRLTKEERDEGLIPPERKKAVPPNPWDDERCDKQCGIPNRAAENMRDQGFSWEEAIRRIKRKFKLSHADAVEATRWIYTRGW
jgi:hypothetical protein